LFDTVIRQQQGLFRRQQARECGFSRYQVRQRLSNGQWQTVVGNVLAVRGTRIDSTVRDTAAVLALPRAILTGPSAARRLGIVVADQRTYVWLPAVPRRCPPGVRPLLGALTRSELSFADGLWVTGHCRAVFDCLRVLPDDPAMALLDRALQQRLTTVPELAAQVRRFAGRRGAPRLARLLQAAAAGTRSAAERHAVTLLRKARIHGWRANEPIHDANGLIGVGDVVFHAVRLVIEVDGWAYHSDRESFERDRERQNRLVAAGWIVLRFTWRDVTERPGYVVSTVREMLARRHNQT
jgi:very-short-patch-repair endonuclease